MQSFLCIFNNCHYRFPPRWVLLSGRARGQTPSPRRGTVPLICQAGSAGKPLLVLVPRSRPGSPITPYRFARNKYFRCAAVRFLRYISSSSGDRALVFISISFLLLGCQDGICPLTYPAMPCLSPQHGPGRLRQELRRVLQRCRFRLGVYLCRVQP